MKPYEKVKGFKNHIKVIFATAVITGFLFYLPLGYVFGCWGNVTVLNNFSKNQTDEIKSVYDLNIPTEAEIKSIKSYSSCQILSFVLTIDNVSDIDSFIKNNPQIEFYQPIGDINILFPNGFRHPHGTDVTCYYCNNKAYISISQNNKDYGKRVSELFVNLKGN